MQSGSRFHCAAAILLIVITAVICGGASGQPVARSEQAFFELPDDSFTRGNWIGAYGRYAYLLAGMRAPKSLFGGPGWPIGLDVKTGDPQEVPRAWRSWVPGEDDKTVLLEPNGLTRTPAIFDDHGEVRKLGAGPDLHLALDIPEGPYLLSLYFFECDWIQYRSFKLSFFSSRDKADVPFLETSIGDFEKGKYKRVLLLGPSRVRIVIHREQSPNAVISGVFLDKVEAPDLKFLSAWIGQETAAAASGTAENMAERETACNKLAAEFEQGQAAAEAFMQAEMALYSDMQRLYEKNMPAYLQSKPVWTAQAKRLEKAAPLAKDAKQQGNMLLLSYHAAHNAFDFSAAAQRLGDVSDLLLATLNNSPREALDTCARMSEALLASGRRQESEIILERYGKMCLAALSQEECLTKLLDMGKKAIPAHATRSLADAVRSWESKYDRKLSGQNALLMANMLYLSGQGAEAAQEYTAAERNMIAGSEQLKWALLAHMTALLDARKVDEAKAVLGQLEKGYRNDRVVDEATFRLAVRYYDLKDFASARTEVSQLMAKDTLSQDYRQMGQELLNRIQQGERERPGYDGGKQQ